MRRKNNCQIRGPSSLKCALIRKFPSKWHGCWQLSYKLLLCKCWRFSYLKWEQKEGFRDCHYIDYLVDVIISWKYFWNHYWIFRCNIPHYFLKLFLIELWVILLVLELFHWKYFLESYRNQNAIYKKTLNPMWLLYFWRCAIS